MKNTSRGYRRRRKRIAKKLFVLHDSTALEDVENSTIISTARSENEARTEGLEDWHGYDFIWFEYDLENGHMTNEKMRLDLPPWCLDESKKKS